MTTYKQSWQSKELILPKNMRIKRPPYAGGRLAVEHCNKTLYVYLRWRIASRATCVTIHLDYDSEGDKVFRLSAPNDPLCWQFTASAKCLYMITSIVNANYRPRTNEFNSFLWAAERLGFEVIQSHEVRECIHWLDGCYTPKRKKRQS